MDKNISAILRNDTNTVCVSFSGGTGKHYTYITDIKFNVGDLAVVCVSGEFKVVTVERVDDDLRIAPNSDMAYKWIAAKLDLTEYWSNMARNAEIEKTLSQAYQKMMRESVAHSVLASFPDEVRTAVKPLLS